MITKRYWLLAGAALAGCLALSACKNRSSTPARKLLVVITPSHDNPFFKAEADAAAAKAKALGFDVLTLSHDDDAGKQDQLVDTAIARGAAAILVDNAGADASVATLKKARAANVAPFLMDREVNATGVATAQIIADNHQGAMLGAREFARLMGESGSYVELVGRESDTNARVRSSAYAEVLDKQAGLVRVARVSANWSQSEAFQKMETLIQKHSDIKGVVAGNDTMALGAAAALKAAGLGKVIVVGFDGSPEAIAAIRSGDLRATVLQPAVQIAEMAVEQIDLFLRTGATGRPEKQSVDCLLVTAENAGTFGVFARK